MKKANRMKWLLVLIPALLLLMLSFLFSGCSCGGTDDPNASNSDEETSAEEPEDIGDYPIYFNVDKKYYYQMTEGGMSGRKLSKDGYYHVLMALDGETTDFIVEKYKTVNVLDNFDLSCVKLSEDGTRILEVARPENAGYTLEIDRFYVTKVSGSTITFNVSPYLTGVDIDFETHSKVRVYSLLENSRLIGESIDVLSTKDQIMVFSKNDTDYVYILPGDGPVWENVYWNVTRQWDSDLLATKREPDEDGYYTIELAVNGHVETFRTKNRDLATLMDSYAARNFGVKLDKNGEIAKVISAKEVTGGGSLASWYTVLSEDEPGVKFHAKKLSTSAKDYGKEADIIVTENTKVYCMNARYEDHYGEETALQVGDQVHCLLDGEGNVCIVFVVARRVNSPIYWNFDRQYDSKTLHTKRTKQADGYYHFIFAVNGTQKELLVETAEMADKIDAYAARNWAFVLEGDVIKKCFSGVQNYVPGISSSAASWYHVTAYNKANGTFHAKKIASGSDKGKEGDFTMAADCKVYNTSTNFTRFAGEETTLQVGDQIHCFKDLDGNIKYIFLISHKENADIYWNVTRKYDTTKKTTTRVPDEEGYYHIEMTTGGKEPVDLITKNKAFIDLIDSKAGRMVALKLAGDGRTITKVLTVTDASGVGGNDASWTHVTSLTKNGFISLKDNDPKNANYGKSFTIKYGKQVKIYNVSGLGAYSGEPTTVKVGDLIHVITDLEGDAYIVFVIERAVVADIYWNITRMYDTAKSETTRVPDGEGYYHFEMTTGGNPPVDLVTKDKAIANLIDSKAGRNIGLTLAKDKKTITGAYASNTVKGYLGGSTASWTHVTEVGDKTFSALKDNDKNHSQYGKTFIFNLSGPKFYNVSGVYGTEDESLRYIGAPTTPEVGDLIHVMLDDKSNPAIVFIIERLSPVTPHLNAHICPDCGEEVTWTPWRNEKSLPASTGHYYLCYDVTTSSTTNMEENATVVIDLNGKRVSTTAKSRIFNCYGKDSTLVLYDCTEDGLLTHEGYDRAGETAGLIAWGHYGDVRAYHVKCDLTGCVTKGNGGAFFTADGYTLELHDVTIKGGSSEKTGGAIYCTAGATVILDNVTIDGAVSEASVKDSIAIRAGSNVTIKNKLTFLNCQNALYFYDGARVTLDGLTGAENMTVRLEKAPGAFTTNYEAGAEMLFTSAMSGYTVGRGDGSALYLGTGPVSAVTADPESLSIKREQTVPLLVSVVPETASDRILVFTSSNENIVTVDANGVVTASSSQEGTAVVTVSIAGTEIKKEIPVTVSGEPVIVTDITLPENTMELFVGAKQTIPYALVPSEASYMKAVFTSGNTAVATVDENGAVSALSEGTAVITVASPKGEVSKTVTVTVSKHLHCVCGNAYEAHVHENPAWEAWTRSDALPNTANDSGKYYFLTKDVTLNGDTAFEGVEVTICLNGHTVTGNARVFQLKTGSKLTLCDCGSGVVKVVGGSGFAIAHLSGGSTFNMYGGTLDSREMTTAAYGMCIYEYDSENVVNLYGGTIYGGNAGAKNATILYAGNTDTVNIYGGEFFGGSATVHGGAIYLGTNATGNMYGGVLHGATALYGGSVDINSAVFNLYGGVITGGKAVRSGSSGGMGGNIAVNSNGTFNMYGGTVENGVAEGNAGGNIAVWAKGAKAVISGGLITGGSSTGSGIAGSASGGISVFYQAEEGCLKIAGGTVSGNKGGVYAVSGSIVLEGAPTILNNENSDLYATVNMIPGALGITAEHSIKLDIGIGDYFLPSDTDYSQAFIAPLEGYAVMYNPYIGAHAFGIEVTEHTPEATHCYCGGQFDGDGTHTKETLTWTAWTDTASVPTETGNYYLTDNVYLIDTETVISGDVNLCLNGFVIIGDRPIEVSGTLTVSDCTAVTKNGFDAVGGLVLLVDGPSDALLVTPGEKVRIYKGVNTNTDRMTNVDLMNPTAEQKSGMKIDVYLIGGQSNASGNTLITSGNSQDRIFAEYPNVSFFHRRRKTTKAVMCDDTSYRSVQEGMGLDGDHIGPELGMAMVLNDLYAGTDKQALIIKSAYGASKLYAYEDGEGNRFGGITDGNAKTYFDERGSWYPFGIDTTLTPEDEDYWKSTGFLLREMLTSIKDVYEDLIEAGYQPENINFVALNWMQGESDNSYPAYYADCFHELMRVLRDYLTALTGKDYSAFKAVVGEISETFSSASESNIAKNQNFNSVQESLPNKDENIFVLPTRGIEINKWIDGASVAVGSDTSHWKYADILTIGQMFAEEAYRAVSGEALSIITVGGVDYRPWTLSDSLPGGGRYYLTEDVTLKASMNLSNSDLMLLLNGHTITGENINRVYILNDESNVLIFDNAEDAKDRGGIVLSGISASAGGVARLSKNSTIRVKNIDVDVSALTTSFGTLFYTNSDANKVFLEDLDVKGGTARGNASSGYTNGEGGVLWIGASDEITIKNCVFEGGSSNQNAGILRVMGNVSIENTRFTGGSTTGEGGAIFASGSKTLHLKDVTVDNCGSGIALSGSVKALVSGKLDLSDEKYGLKLVSTTATLEMEGEGLSEGSFIRILAAQDTNFLTAEENLFMKGYLESASETLNGFYDTGSKAHYLNAAVPHAHCECGETVDWTKEPFSTVSHTEKDVTWKALSDGEALRSLSGNQETETHYYLYLENDITLSGSFNIYTNQHFHLCLNGHTLKGANGQRVFSTYNAKPGSLTICDCSAEESGSVVTGTAFADTSTNQGQAMLIYNAGSSLTLYGGTIKGGHAKKNFAGNIYVASGTTFNMYGGSIEDGITDTESATQGGGNVGIAGVMNLYGGIIKNGQSTKSMGGNIALNSTGTLNMYGGTVENGTAATFGGNIGGCSGAKINIFGGDINGGTVETDARVGSYSSSTSYTNVAKGFGGSIGAQGAVTLNLSGGTISGGTIKATASGMAFGGNIGLVSTRDANGINSFTVNISGTPIIKNGSALSSANVDQSGNSLAGGNISFGGPLSEYMDAAGTVTITGGTFTMDVEDGAAHSGYGVIYTGSNKVYTRGGNLFFGKGVTATISGTVEISNGYVEGGTQWGVGGNICTLAKSLVVSGPDVVIKDGYCGSGQEGGNIYANASASTATFDHVTISGGCAKNGGNILAENTNLYMTDCVLIDGYAASNGGNAYFKGANANATLTGVTMLSGSAGGTATNFYVNANVTDKTVTLVDCFLGPNKSGTKANAYVGSGAKVVLQGGYFQNNLGSAYIKEGYQIVETDETIDGVHYAYKIVPLS